MWSNCIRQPSFGKNKADTLYYSPPFKLNAFDELRFLYNNKTCDMQEIDFKLNGFKATGFLLSINIFI